MEIMLILVTYDVNTETAAGRKRLRKVAKQCVNYGQRVQNSVFECQVDSVKFRQMKAVLEDLIDKEKDSLRFYNLGDKYQNKVEHIGANPGFDVTDTLIF
ncbi:MAG: CRISPR-associated endonuclease Cas2 [Eubacterium sp.]|jgi:CRISPR-associated protein Cas2|nr:CRISPR-associated endonuclease Cas2 [Eubacterium sp.]